MIRRLIYTVVLLAAAVLTLDAQEADMPKRGKSAGSPPPVGGTNPAGGKKTLGGDKPVGGDTPADLDASGAPGALQDTVFTIPDYNADLPTGSDILRQDVSLKPVKKFHSTHMVGVRYGVSLATAKFSPDLRPGKVLLFNDYGIVYTYYNDLWDMLDNFGTQLIARVGHEGFTTEYDVPDMQYTVAEVDLMTNLRFNIKSFRLLANVGPYAGYRIANNRASGEWLYTDNRFDYGLIFGGGAGISMGPFEFQLETNYKWGLSSYFHTYYYSDEYWLFAFPRVFLFSGTLYYKF
ncbi:MAG: hypothetical protein J6X89_04025 [Bacteroidales bacterium]|nr:hypothetical protein [Bacteroidales bacterium]